MSKKTLKKKSIKKAPIKRRGLFDEFKQVKNLARGESLRFRDKNGRLVKFDGRKKLIAEVWVGRKRSDRVLNRVNRKKQPYPQKFYSKSIKKRIQYSQAVNKGPRISSEPRSKKFKIDSRFLITDNIEAKCPEVAEDTIKFSKRKNGTMLTIELTYRDSTKNLVSTSINAVTKSTNRQFIFDEIARLIVYHLYRNKMRASNMIDSRDPEGEKTYVRSIETKITWDETKRL